MSDGPNEPFKTAYTTRWLHAGWPERKKRWRRPTFIARAGDQEYTIRCSLFADYEESEVRRQFDVTINAATGVVTYDSGFLYDSGVEYTAAGGGSTIARGGAFGTAKAVQLKIEGQPGKPWGVNGVVAKFRMRRFT
jgi:hypothetical protein